MIGYEAYLVMVSVSLIGGSGLALFVRGLVRGVEARGAHASVALARRHARMAREADARANTLAALAMARAAGVDPWALDLEAQIARRAGR